VASLVRHSDAAGVAVYNLEVEGDHTYFVGNTSGGVWVHNDCAELLSPFELTPTHAIDSFNRVRALMRSISAKGIKESVKYIEHNGSKYIVDGHHRVMAAKHLGLETVPAERVGFPYGQYETPADLSYDPLY